MMIEKKSKTKSRWAGHSSLSRADNLLEVNNKIFHSNFYTSLPKNFFERDEINDILVCTGQKNVVVLYGMGGIGKTTMLTKLCNIVKEDEHIACDKVAYYDLKNKDSFISIAKSILNDLFAETVLPDDENELITKIVYNMSQSSSLIVLDNLESLMDIGERSGKMQPEFISYEKLIDRVSSMQGPSTLILSGREKIDLGSKYSENIEFCKLKGISIAQAQVLLKDFDLKGKECDWKRFVDLYSGNALTLKIVGYEIADRFDGDIVGFLNDPEMPHELIELLDEQFSRFNLLEKVILLCCAVAREQVDESYIEGKLVEVNSSRQTVRKSIKNIVNHCYLETSSFEKNIHYYLQPVIMDFLSSKLIDVFQNEIIECTPKFIALIPLIDTVAKEYILNIQKLMLVLPLENMLVKRYGSVHVVNMLKKMCTCITEARNYAIGNIIVILSSFNKKISNWDFSNRYVINADLRNLQVTDCNFSNATFENVLLKNTFGNLIDAKFSYDDTMIIGGATDYSLNAWNCKDLSFAFKLKAHTDWIRSVDSSHKYLVSASNDESINIYDYTSHNLIRTLNVGCRVRKVMLSTTNSDYLYSSGDNGIIYKWSIIDGSKVAFVGHTGVVWSFDFLTYKGNSYLVSVSDDKSAILWDLNSGKSKCILHHICEIKSVVCDGKDKLFLGCENGDIVVYSLSKAEIIYIAKGHNGIVWGMDYDIKSNRLISGSSDRHVILWRNESSLLTKEKILDAHNSGIWNVNFNGTGDRFVTTGDDYEFKVWDAGTYRELYCIKGYTNLLRNICVSDINQALYVAGDDTIIREYDLNVPTVVQRRFIGHTNRVRHVDISSDGKQMLSCGDDGMVILWDLVTKEKKIFRGHQKRVWSVCFISNDVFASAGEENDIYLWHPNEDAPFFRISGHSNWIWDISYNLSSGMLISASEDNTCRCWNILNLQELKNKILALHQKWLFSATASSNGRYVVTTSADNTALVCDIENNDTICKLTGHKGWVWSAIFLENDVVVTGSQDSTIRIWKIDHNQRVAECLKLIEAHKSWVVSLAYSKEKQRFFSASADETVKMWDAKTFEYIGDFTIDKPYDGMLIKNAHGLSSSEKESLVNLGAKL